MNRDLGLKILSQIMAWDQEESDEARSEFDWVLFMSAYKYDGYRDYLAGARFIEHLCTWLQQFKKEDRAVAYRFIKEKLIYFSPEEIQRLVEKFFPEIVQKDLITSVANQLNIKPYQIWSSEKNIAKYEWEKRKTLFMGLSDGARLGALRRSNAGTLSNEQIVITTQTDQTKWASLLVDLRKDLKKNRANVNVSNERFSRVYLLDDFTGSGTSVLPDIRFTKGKLKGKLYKFAKSLESDGVNPFDDDFSVVVHHYIGTEDVRSRIESVYAEVRQEFNAMGLKNISFTFGLLLPTKIKYGNEVDDEFVRLCQEYYNDAIEGDGEHGGQSGIKEKMFGYGQCGLPIVLEHNTPNNSLPLIWADTADIELGPKMRPLFRRRERHSDMKNNSNTGNDNG